MASKTLATFTDQNFDRDVLESTRLVLVDFWAEWCGPCRALAPAIAALADEYAGEITVGKLNVDESPNVTLRYQVRGIPTLILFKDGKALDRMVGLADMGALKRMVEKHIRSHAVPRG